MDRRDFFLGLGGTSAAGLTTLDVRADPSADAPARSRLTPDGARVVESQRDISVSHKAGVVVVGATTGGLGGCFAAIAAARRGAKTILVEEAGHIDLHVPIGLGVVIGIGGWLPTVEEGLFKEFAERVCRGGPFSTRAATFQDVVREGGLLVRYHEVVTTALLEMLVEAGVQLLFHTRLVGVAAADGQVQALVVESPRGRHAITAKTFVDGTGLGDLAAGAGAPMHREEPFMGLQAFLGGVDEARYQKWLAADNKPLDASYREWLEKEVGPFAKLAYPWDQWWPEYLGDRMPPAVVRRVREAHARKEFTLLRRHGRSGVLAIPEGLKVDKGVARPRTYVTGIDPLDVDALNWAEVQSRLALLELYRFLRKSVPGFERSVPERLGDEVSLRGGRYIAIERNITKREIDTGGKSADCIYLHRSGATAKVYEVPFRALVPQKVSNMLVVGKSTAAGVHLRQAHGVLFQGQAAGIAAAMAAKDGVPMAGINIGAIQKALKAGGVALPY